MAALVMTAAVVLLSGDAGATRPAPIRPAASTLDLANDPNNCAAAGFRVPAGDICRYGVATPG